MGDAQRKNCWVEMEALPLFLLKTFSISNIKQTLIKLKTKEEPSTSRDEHALYVGNRYKGKKDQLFCDFYKRTGHTEKFCHARKRSQMAYLVAVKEEEENGAKEEEDEDAEVKT